MKAAGTPRASQELKKSAPPEKLRLSALDPRELFALMVAAIVALSLLYVLNRPVSNGKTVKFRLETPDVPTKRAVHRAS